MNNSKHDLCLVTWPRLRLLLLTLVAYLTVACSAVTAAPAPPTEPAVSGPQQPQTPTIGLLLSSLYNPLYVSLQSGAVESASRLDVELIVREASDDAGKQNQQLEELLTLGVDALVINPVDSAAISGGVRRANAAGVPVITVERRVSGASISAHVASDNIAGGEMAASYLADMLREEGRVAELVGTPETSAAQDRSSGFTRIIGSYPQIEVVAREVANFDRRQARRAFAAILEQESDLDGVFAHNDEMILGAIEAAQEAGRASDIVFIGFDGVDDAIEALEQGLLTATVAQQPTEMGRIAIELAVGQLRGDTIAPNVAVDLALVTR